MLPKNLGKCLLEKISVYEMPVSQILLGKMPVGQNVCQSNGVDLMLVGNFSIGQNAFHTNAGRSICCQSSLYAKCHSAKMLVGQMPFGQMLVDQMLVGQSVFYQKT
jgi:hypothetical protein